MKVLFVTRPHIGLNKGGLRTKIDNTAAELRRIGVDVIYFDPWQNQLPEVDVCHCFSAYGRMYYHATEAKKCHIPLVISPVFAPYDVPLWQMTLKVRSSFYIPGWLTEYKLLKNLFDMSDRILPLHQQEAHRIATCFGISRKRMTIVPNGIDNKFASGDPALFEQKYGAHNFVLQVGTIDPNKNQLTVLRAITQLPYTYVIVGEPLSGNDDYLRACKAVAGRNVIFTGHIDYNDPLLTSAYAAAKVFIMPSFSEVMPHALYQAAQAGCSLVVSKNIPTDPVIAPKVLFAHPGSIRHMRAQIDAAMKSPRNPALRTTALAMPDWPQVAKKIADIYREVTIK